MFSQAVRNSSAGAGGWAAAAASAPTAFHQAVSSSSSAAGGVGAAPAPAAAPPPAAPSGSSGVLAGSSFTRALLASLSAPEAAAVTTGRVSFGRNSALGPALGAWPPPYPPVFGEAPGETVGASGRYAPDEFAAPSWPPPFPPPPPQHQFMHVARRQPQGDAQLASATAGVIGARCASQSAAEASRRVGMQGTASTASVASAPAAAFSFTQGLALSRQRPDGGYAAEDDGPAVRSQTAAAATSIAANRVFAPESSARGASTPSGSPFLGSWGVDPSHSLYSVRSVGPPPVSHSRIEKPLPKSQHRLEQSVQPQGPTAPHARGPIQEAGFPGGPAAAAAPSSSTSSFAPTGSTRQPNASVLERGQSKTPLSPSRQGSGRPLIGGDSRTPPRLPLLGVGIGGAFSVVGAAAAAAAEAQGSRPNDAFVAAPASRPFSSASAPPPPVAVELRGSRGERRLGGSLLPHQQLLFGRLRHRQENDGGPVGGAPRSAGLAVAGDDVGERSAAGDAASIPRLVADSIWTPKVNLPAPHVPPHHPMPRYAPDDAGDKFETFPWERSFQTSSPRRGGSASTGQQSSGHNNNAPHQEKLQLAFSRRPSSSGSSSARNAAAFSERVGSPPSAATRPSRVASASSSPSRASGGALAGRAQTAPQQMASPRGRSVPGAGGSKSEGSGDAASAAASSSTPWSPRNQRGRSASSTGSNKSTFYYTSPPEPDEPRRRPQRARFEELAHAASSTSGTDAHSERRRRPEQRSPFDDEVDGDLGGRGGLGGGSAEERQRAHISFLGMIQANIVSDSDVAEGLRALELLDVGPSTLFRSPPAAARGASSGASVGAASAVPLSSSSVRAEADGEASAIISPPSSLMRRQPPKALFASSKVAGAVGLRAAAAGAGSPPPQQRKLQHDE